MSKLDELIKLYCPKGIEYYFLSEVISVKEKTAIKKEQLSINGKYPVINSSREVLGYYDYFNNYGETLVLTSHGAYAGYCHYLKNKFWAGSLCYPMQAINKNSISTKFLYYFLKNIESTIRDEYVNKSGVPYINFKALMNIKVPFPPLEVQCEIVRILDNFTELTAELTAELTVRKKQYEYYRDKLIGNKNYQRKKLGEIATEMFRGNGIKRDEVTETGIPCIRYGEIYTSYGIYFDKCISYTREDVISNPKILKKYDILFAITGESIEEIAKTTCYLGDEEGYVGGDIVVMRHNQNAKYISYALSTIDAIKQKGMGKVKSKVVHTNIPSLKEISIPLPSLEEQQRIVDILDKFDKYCNDLTRGLPAEIETRQKQYEYNRDKLLTFKKLEV